MPESHRIGLLDTSVVIDLPQIDSALLPEELAISVVTLAELSAAPAYASDPMERSRRQARLQLVESLIEPIPFGVEAARAYGLIASAVLAAGRLPRSRAADLMIAATALAEDLPLLTRNAGDLKGLEGLIDILPV